MIYQLLPDDRLLTVYPLTFGRAKLAIGSAAEGYFDNEW